MRRQSELLTGWPWRNGRVAARTVDGSSPRSRCCSEGDARRYSLEPLRTAVSQPRLHSSFVRVRVLRAVPPSVMRLAALAAREALLPAQFHHEHCQRRPRRKKDAHRERMARGGRVAMEAARERALFRPPVPPGRVQLPALACAARASDGKIRWTNEKLIHPPDCSAGACVRRRRHRRRRGASTWWRRRIGCDCGGGAARWRAPVALWPRRPCGRAVRGCARREQRLRVWPCAAARAGGIRQPNP